MTISARGRAARLIVLATAMAAGAAPAALAQEGRAMQGDQRGVAGPADTIVWTPRIEASLSFTDNVDGEPGTAADSDLYLNLTPGINVRAVRPKWRAFLDYEIDGVRYWYKDDNDLLHRLAHAGTVEVLNDLLFVDTRAFIRQEVLNPSAGLSAREQLAPFNADTVASLGVSPYVLNRWGGFANSELRYRLDHVVPFDDSFATGTFHTVSAALTSGSDFNLLRWGLVGYGQEADYSSDQAFANRSSQHAFAELSLAYDLNRHVSLLGSGGYEHLDDETYRDDISEPIWSAGFQLRATPQTALTALYRHRYGREFFEGNAAWQIGPATRLTASYTEQITTTQRLLADRLQNLAVDDNGNLIDVSSLPLVVDEFGQPVDNISFFGLQRATDVFGVRDFAFNRNRAQLRGDWIHERDAVAVILFHEQRWSDVVAFEQKATGLSARWEHDLSRELSGRVTARYRYVDYEDLGDRFDHIFGGGALLRYQIAPRTTVYGEYQLLVDAPNTSDATVENVVTVGIRKLF